MTVGYPKCACDATHEPVVQFRDQRALWQVRERWSERFADPAAPDWFALERDSRAECVKRGYARATWRVTLGDQLVYAKVFDDGGLVNYLKRYLLGGGAEKEWRASREAERRGIPVAHALALGTSCGRPRREVFLSQDVGSAVNLAEIWEREVVSSSAGTRRAAGAPLIEAAGTLFATAHERGFVHGDAHPNNILVRAPRGGRHGLFFVDVHSARVNNQPASVKRSVESLAQLDNYFRRRATRSERLRFLRVYLRQRPSMARYVAEPFRLRGLLSNLARHARAGAARLARTRDRRLRGDGKYFCRLALGDGWRVAAVLRLERRHVFPEAGVPDRSESDWRALLSPLLAQGHAAFIDGDSIAAGKVCLDLKKLESFWERLSATLRGSVHRRIFEQCHRLRHRDVAADLILGCLEHRRSGLVDATVLIHPPKG